MAGGNGGPGSKPTAVPFGSQVQAAYPWAGGGSYSPQGTSPPAPGDGQASDGGIIGGTPLQPKFGTSPPANSWRSTLAGGIGAQPFGNKMGSSSKGPGSGTAQARPWTMDPRMMPGMQAQIAAANPPAPTTSTPTPTPAPTTPVAPTVPTQSAVSPTIGSAIDPSVMAGLSAEERANYQIDPASGTWIRVR